MVVLRIKYVIALIDSFMLVLLNILFCLDVSLNEEFGTKLMNICHILVKALINFEK